MRVDLDQPVRHRAQSRRVGNLEPVSRHQVGEVLADETRSLEARRVGGASLSTEARRDQVVGDPSPSDGHRRRRHIHRDQRDRESIGEALGCIQNSGRAGSAPAEHVGVPLYRRALAQPDERIVAGSQRDTTPTVAG